MEAWDHFVGQSPQGCIFCRSWWLDAVCPNGYEILILRKGDRIVAGMPLVRCRRFGCQAIGMPPLTQTLGVLLAPPTAEKYERQLSGEMELLRALVAAIPRADHFVARCHHSFANWLPFYWAGYQQTTRYTYVIEDLTDPEAVFANFAHSKRKNIKKAERLVEVREDMPPMDLYDHHATSLRKAGDTIVYTYELFERIHRATHEHNAGKTWLAVDVDGHIHSAIFVVFDRSSAYYLISTIDPDYRSSDSATLLVKRAIEYVATRTKRFDFEGSMIENVERSFRSFGARQMPYFKICRDKRNPLVKAYCEFRSAGATLARRLGLRR
jgi:hypothetical protein